MKNIFDINIFTYFIGIILIFSGFINYVYIYLLVMITHELGHIIMIKLMGYKIHKIIVYPTCFIIKTNINYNINSNKLLLISISGILFQLLLYFINIDMYYKDILFIINTNVILINLIPVYPLDGYKIVLSFIERFINYRYTLYILFIISYISLILVLFITKSVILLIFLYYLNIKLFIFRNYIYNKFILERYLYKIKYKNNKYIKNSNLYKNYNNYIFYINSYVNEDKYLDNYFT